MVTLSEEEWGVLIEALHRVGGSYSEVFPISDRAKMLDLALRLDRDLKCATGKWNIRRRAAIWLAAKQWYWLLVHLPWWVWG